MPADYRTPYERLLAAMTEAMELRGLGSSVGLRPAENFPAHRGGIGISISFPTRTRAALRPAAAGLLTAMGCIGVRPHETGVEGHLRDGTELLPAPPLPPVPVSSADSSSVAELTEVTVTTGKLCRGPCGEFKDLQEFSLNGRTPEGRQRRMHWCRPCHAAQQRERHAARVGAGA